RAAGAGRRARPGAAHGPSRGPRRSPPGARARRRGHGRAERAAGHRVAEGRLVAPPEPRAAHNGAMAVRRTELIGRWRRVGDEPAADAFPREVEFFADGTYRAAADGTRRGAWDEASFDVLDDGSVRIETANDRKVRYAADLDHDELT